MGVDVNEIHGYVDMPLVQLRFVMRDGEKVLQQAHLRSFSYVISEKTQKTVWLDVPIKSETE